MCPALDMMPCGIQAGKKETPHRVYAEPYLHRTHDAELNVPIYKNISRPVHSSFNLRIIIRPDQPWRYSFRSCDSEIISPDAARWVRISVQISAAAYRDEFDHASKIDVCFVEAVCVIG